MTRIILVVFEQRDGVIRQSSIDVWNRAQALKQQGDISVVGIVPGPAGSADEFRKITGDGDILHVDEQGLELCQPQAYADVIAAAAREHSSTVLMLADTAFGADLAPRLCARLRASLISHCRSLSFEGDHLLCETAWYAGTVSALLTCEHGTAVLTLTGGRCSASGHDRPRLVPTTLEHPEPSGWNPVVEKLVSASSSTQDVAEADIVIAGGRGLGGPEGFGMLESLAGLVGGSVGASRSVVDEGWRPHAEQVGQTGKTIAPSLYVACGISGAVQHLAGIAAAQTVVAINSDPEAPIFRAADAGIVGDVFDVLPKLEGLLREKLAGK